MNINATIIVQIFNFCIAYWMLRIFLFKPVVAIIEHEKAQEQAIHDSIDQQRKSLEIQEKERLRHWYMCQEYFNTNQPDTVSPQFSGPTDDDHVPNQVSPHIVTDMITHAQTALEEKIKHVH